MNKVKELQNKIESLEKEIQTLKTQEIMEKYAPALENLKEQITKQLDEQRLYYCHRLAEVPRKWNINLILQVEHETGYPGFKSTLATVKIRE